MHNLETKHLSSILAVENQSFFIKSDTTLSEERVEYYDGQGNIVYLFEYDHDSKQTKHWMKQDQVPYNLYHVYTNGKRDSSFIEKQLNDSTYVLEYYVNDSLFRSTNILLDTQTILILPDSTIVEMKYDNQHSFSEIRYLNKNNEPKTTIEYEVLARDKKGNWIKRLEKIISDNRNYTFLHQRKIKYADDYEVLNYFELSIDTLILDGRQIADPEILNPNPNGKLAYQEQDEAFNHKIDVYRSIQNLFHQKYFNNYYFLNFSTNKKGATKVLEDRLLYYYPTVVFDVKSKKYFSGRTQSKRWFDKTASFNRLEQLEPAPVPTDRWVQINGYNCREYIKSNSIGKTDRFFVTEQLPFINYCDFTFVLPGFVIKSERYLPVLGEVELVMNLKKCRYPFHFLEFVKELNEKFGTAIRYVRKKEK